MGRAFGPEESEQAKGGGGVSGTNDECGMTNVELPDGWIRLPFSAVTIDPLQRVPGEKEQIIYIDIGSVDRVTKQVVQPQTMLGKDAPSRARKVVHTGDVLVSTVRPNLNAVALVESKYNGQFASTGFDVLRSPVVDPRWLFYSVRTPEFLDRMSELVQGALYPAVRSFDIRSFVIPLAPLAEQKRIADKLEAVLRRVDACRARLDRVPALLKRFRQSVLAAAISGRLTEEWRAANPKQKPWLTVVSEKPIALPPGYKRLSKQSFKPTIIQHDATDLPDTWCVQTVNQLYSTNCLIDFADGNHGGLYPRKEEFGVDGALFLTATQMDNAWGVALDECPRLNWKKAKQLTKGWAQNDDVLLSHNATVGRVGILEGASEDVLLGTSVTFYRFNPKYILPRFGRIIFSSRFFKDQLESVMKQTTRDQVPITKQVSLNCICAPIDEQQEIVRRVEDLFAFADRIEARLATAQKTVERLTPATFAKAFRGELVPQDPNDEPASALLERLRSQPASPTTKTARKVLPVRIKH